MSVHQEDTSPSSVNGDDINDLDAGLDDDVIYLEVMEEITLDDEDNDIHNQIHSEDGMDEEREPPDDHASQVFWEHNSSVFCCDLHPSGKLAVTGGEDDIGYVWSVDNGQTIMKCTNYKDSVIFVGFSADGTYLACADMGGLIKVWKCNLEDNQPWPMVFEYEADDLLWGQWHFGTKVLLVGCVSGDIYVFKIPSGETKILQGHNIKVECAKLFKDGVHLAAGYEDGSYKIWDLRSSLALHQIPASIHQHNVPVTAMDTQSGNNLLATIDTQGKVVLTTINGKIVGTLETGTDLEAVAFSQQPQLGYLALGTLKGSISIWDVSKQTMRLFCEKSDDNTTGGVIKLLWVKNYLIAGCLDGSIRIYDGLTGERKTVLTGHMDEILDFCYNEKENIILTSSDDGTARIFKYNIN